jgi:hypothetical protein
MGGGSSQSVYDVSGDTMYVMAPPSQRSPPRLHLSHDACIHTKVYRETQPAVNLIFRSIGMHASVEKRRQQERILSHGLKNSGDSHHFRAQISLMYKDVSVELSDVKISHQFLAQISSIHRCVC